MKTVLAFLAACWMAAVAMAGEKPVNTTLFGVAIKGYDAVAYFTDHKPVEGVKAFEFVWQDAKWRFASAEHRDAFKAAPDKYAPQYGGYCAWAVSQGYTANIDPEAWTIVEGKLYLNYSLDVRQKWKLDIPGFIKAADKNWPKIKE